MKVVSLTAGVVAAFTAPALAHHSFAMFDKTVTSSRTIRTPSFAFMVNDEKTGKPVLWAIELKFAGLAGHAWDAGRLRERGDRVSMTFDLLKDGSRGGRFI